MPDNLNGRKLLAFVGDDYEDLELWYPKLRMAEAGVSMVLAGQEAKQKQSALIDQLTREFNEGATSALAAVSTAASRMKGSAQKMSHVAAQAKEQTGAVASASEQAAANVQTVRMSLIEVMGGAPTREQLDARRGCVVVASDDADTIAPAGTPRIPMNGEVGPYDLGGR